MRRFALLLSIALAGCDVPQPQLAAQNAPAAEVEVSRTRLASLPDFTAIVQKQGPAVVNVITRVEARVPRRGAFPQLPNDPFFEFFRRFIPDLPERGFSRQGLGSGFIISEDGYILTNAHVVANADEVTVRLADAKREFKAKLIGSDERTDIALLKVEATGLPTVTLGDSSKLRPGEWVAAIGSPFGFSNTVTAGIVSATGRSLPDEAYVPFIQTDVAVNPGNSGGPLLNLKGEVVGINSQIYSGTGGYMGVSFAIPIEVALDISKQLRTEGKVTRGRIGVGIQPVTRELAQAFGMEKPQGALIASVDPGGPADKAGVQVGDVVLGWNGDPVEDVNELPRVVARTRPGDTVSVEIWRGGERREIEVTVGEFPSESTRIARKAPGEDTEPNLGLVVSELPPAQRRSLGVDYGVVVHDVKDPASPLRSGDVIVAVNRERFDSLEEFKKLIAAHDAGDTVALLVRRGEAALYIPAEVG
jgi:serine protease Do